MNPSRNINVLAAFLTATLATSALSADPAGWAGEFKNAKLLGGKATLQLSVEQQGSKVQVSFDAVRNDGKGPAPEGQGHRNRLR